MKWQDGRTVLMLGLSFGNLDKFKAAPLDTYIKVNGWELDLPIDVLVFSGETERDLEIALKDRIGPYTKVHDGRKP